MSNLILYWKRANIIVFFIGFLFVFLLFLALTIASIMSEKEAPVSVFIILPIMDVLTFFITGYFYRKMRALFQRDASKEKETIEKIQGSMKNLIQKSGIQKGDTHTINNSQVPVDKLKEEAPKENKSTNESKKEDLKEEVQKKDTIKVSENKIQEEASILTKEILKILDRRSSGDWKKRIKHRTSKTLMGIKIVEEDILEEVLGELQELKQFSIDKHISQNQSSYSFILKHYLKTAVELTKNSYPELFSIINEVCELFEIIPDIRVFKIKRGGVENAFVIGDNNKLIIGFCDNILNLITDKEELKYVIGHELAHYAYHHTDPCISNHILNVMRSPEPIQPELKRFLEPSEGFVCMILAFIVQQLKELNADRAGMYASGNFNASVNAALKISAGSVDNFGTYDPGDYLNQADQLIRSGEYFDLNDIFRTHPIEALRVKAIHLFYTSNLYAKLNKSSSSTYDIENFINDLMKIIPLELVLNKIQSDQSHLTDYAALLIFSVATVILADNKLTEEEFTYFEKIKLRHSLNTELKKLLDKIDFIKLNQKEREDIIKEYCEKCKSLSYHQKFSIVDQMIQAAKADRKIVLEELKVIFLISSWLGVVDIAEKECKNQFGWKLKYDEEKDAIEYVE